MPDLDLNHLASAAKAVLADFNLDADLDRFVASGSDSDRVELEESLAAVGVEMEIAKFHGDDTLAATLAGGIYVVELIMGAR